MLLKRIVVCLDVMNGRVVKGVNFTGLRDVGDPAELAEHYEASGADEIVFLDISASSEGRRTLLDVVRRTAERLFIPLTVGGGINDVDDIAAALKAGADKVSINSAAVKRPELITEASERFGRQCVVASIDARLDGARFRLFTHGGRAATTLEAVPWALTCTQLGAGEILITSIDRDGARNGYDLPLTDSVASAVNVPVIASGGAGNADHIRDVLLHTGADAALVAGIFHDGVTTVRAVKRTLAAANIRVRECA
ncbi:MAG: imidazole glycerol phosphate synthase subunit HisF [Gemmatimonadota bacterium]